MDNGYQSNDPSLNISNSNNNVQISQSTSTLLNLQGSLDGNSPFNTSHNIPQINTSNNSLGFLNNSSMMIDEKRKKIKNEEGSFDQTTMGVYTTTTNVNNNNQNGYLDTFQQFQQQHLSLMNSNQYSTTNNQNINQNNNQNNMYMSQSQQQPQQQQPMHILGPIPSISITPTHDHHSLLQPNNRAGLTSSGNYSPRPSPNGSPHHSPIGSPNHSPLLHNDNYLSLNSDNDTSEQIASSFSEPPPFGWNNYKSEAWYPTLNANGEPMPTPLLNIIATKGFSYINGQWVYCRRNHFQLDITAAYPKIQQDYISNLSSSSSNIDPSQTPSYLLIDGAKMPINGLTLTIKGIKNRTDMTQPETEVELFQTNSKREKQGEHAPKPVAIQFGTLISIQRLHFRKATLNNARRNGQPNPHQEFNQLVVSLYGRCMAQEYCIVSFSSPPLIVRTAISSPSVSPAATDLSPVHTPDTHHTTTTNIVGNNNNINNNQNTINPFGSNFPDVSGIRLHSPSHTPNSPRNMHNSPNLQPQMMNIPGVIKSGVGSQSCEWLRGEGDKAIFYNGKVGINCDNPTFTLSVQGTIYASENVFHPSDMRLKYDQRPVENQLSLRNVNKLKIYDYRLNPQWAMMCGRDPYNDTQDRGVMAQDLQAVLPNAVRTIGNRNINGNEIENLLVINSEALIYENIGATQCLSKQFDSLNEKLEQQEKTIQSLKSNSKKSNIFIIVLFILLILMISLLIFSNIQGHQYQPHHSKHYQELNQQHQEIHHQYNTKYREHHRNN